MSLIRLLTVGRSVLSVREQPSPYRISQQHLLPKFGQRGSGDGDRVGKVVEGNQDGTKGNGMKATTRRTGTARTWKESFSILGWSRLARVVSKKSIEAVPVQGELKLEG